MLLNEKDGINCDICHTTYKKNFTYYSYDFKERKVFSNIMEQMPKNTPTNLSLDVCESCNEKIKQVIIKHYKPSPCLPTRNYHKGIFCDLSSTNMNGTYTLIHCDVSKVEVLISDTSHTCLGCGVDIKNIKEPCPKCQSGEFAKKADIRASKGLFEMWICEQAFQQFKQSGNSKKREIQKEALKWSSSSE